LPNISSNIQEGDHYMKKNLFATVGTFILLTILFVPSAFALGFGASADYWIPAFNGDLRVDGNGITGDEINLKDDLGISNENIPGAEAYFGVGNHQITLAYSQVNLSGDKRINKEIKFNGETYLVNEPVESEFKTSMIDLEYQYKLINFNYILAGLSFGIIAKVKYFDGDVKIKSSSANTNKKIQVPIPMIGLGAKIGLLANILEARAKVTGMGYSGSFFYDAMADLSLTPIPFLNIHGGYRAMSVKIDNVSDVYAKMDFYGPYVGLLISF
jgi:outer membrane protein